MIEKLLLAILGGGNIILFVKFLIERHDRKKERQEEKEGLKDEILTLKKDGIRTQLLLMILIKPGEEQEILKIAETYFEKLKGNWYMTSIFNKWLEANKVAKPEWFNKEGGDQV